MIGVSKVICMIINVRLNNYRSFEKETTFSMVPSYTKNDDPDIINIAGNVNVLRFGLLYGANSSGKTNLIKFIYDFGELFFKGFSNPSLKKNYCRNHEANMNKPTIFEITFSSEQRIFTYGVKTLLSKQTVLSEWVDEIMPSNGKIKHLFLREDTFKTVEDFFPSAKKDEEKQRLSVYINDLLESKNPSGSLFATELSSKKYDKKSQFYFLKEVRHFF